jgi:hypothetical protein
MTGKQHLLHSIHHFLTGVVLLIKGIDKISHHIIIGVLILVFGVSILSFFVYSLFKIPHSRNLELMVRWFEALATLFTAYIFFMEGKSMIQYVFLLASIGFFISIYIFHKNKKELVEKHDL